MYISIWFIFRDLWKIGVFSLDSCSIYISYTSNQRRTLFIIPWLAPLQLSFITEWSRNNAIFSHNDEIIISK